MSDAQNGPLIYSVPLGLWVTVGVALLSAGAAVLVAWRSNANARRNIEKQLRRSAEEFDRKLDHESAQLALQLHHDADQRDRERQMALRREVYLEAAAALTHANGLIGRITNIENDQKMLGDEFATDLSKIAKVHIVGSDQTVQAIMNYVNVLGPSFTELTAMRVPLMIRKAAIDLEGTFVDAALAERKRFAAMMQQLNLDQETDSAKWDPIHRQSEIAAETYRSHALRKQELWREQVDGIFVIVRHSLSLVDKLVRLLPAAILAVRTEMEMPLEPEWYASLWSDQLANMKVVTDDLLASLKRSSETPPDPT